MTPKTESLNFLVDSISLYLEDHEPAELKPNEYAALTGIMLVAALLFDCCEDPTRQTLAATYKDQLDKSRKSISPDILTSCSGDIIDALADIDTFFN